MNLNPDDNSSQEYYLKLFYSKLVLGGHLIFTPVKFFLIPRGSDFKPPNYIPQHVVLPL